MRLRSELTIHTITATVNVVQGLGGVGGSSWSAMSVYVPHDRSKQCAEGLGEFISIIEKARAERRAYLMAGDLSWYGLRGWHDEKNRS